MQLPLSGDLFEGRYELLMVLGEGGFARVYRARDTQLGREVALKVNIPRRGEYSDTSSKRFHREARVIAGLQDPHTITLYDYGESSEGLLWMAFEYVAGEDLRQFVARRGPLSPSIVAHILGQLLSSLREAHQAGVLHRDIKPENVLVYEYGGDPHTVKLLDFGIAKPTTTPHTKITQTGTVVGTPRYMAPEQLFGDPVRPASDVFSLGLVAYEMLAGAPATEGSNVEELLGQRVRGEEIRVPEELAPPALRRIVEQMCAPDIEQRFQSAPQVLAALRSAREEIRTWTAGGAPAPTPHAVEHRTIPRPQAQPAADRSRRFNAATAAAGGLALVAIALVVYAVQPDDEVTTPPASPDRASRVNPLGGSAGTVVVPEPDLAPPAPVVRGGCGLEPPFVGGGVVEQMEGLSLREHHLYVPKGYDPGRRHPVLLVFHDVQQTGSVLRRSQMDRLADELGLVVVLPQDADRGPWWDAADVERTREAIDHAASILCVDTGRVFAYGHGAGGRIVERLPCEMDTIVATAAMSFRPKPGEVPCKPRRPAPHLNLATLKNGYSPPEGGQGCGTTVSISVAEQEELRREVAGCTGEKRRYKRHRDGTCWTWDCDAEFVSCHVDGGREWPDTAKRSWDMLGCDGEPSEFGLRDTIREFFEAHAESE